ncbi:phosphoribosylformimino-5-aminoimidazole carboxamide ribotide isomerase [Paraburkholderia sp. CNPSo 3157]|uniref:Phosphoribosylformimino-5-aminoimidazole carboxamide ribotide isomerase n=1 Tax=Paraburkholderia franconis TaxID=2654983 RepID=A0A7X1NE60_9BURK|nr:HisA/HisF-related TIM barrel protein [Paraburkholderia franconis]MPW20245.1 phosphoribosylformimino-5-aminoimidazole carboxamide ribotide isomerase [Paraburkholderia franconis]
MQVIPVLDLLDAHAVRAIRGDRANYRPIQSSLCATSEPLAVARALLAASRTRVLYVADLGAIMSRDADPSTLAALATSLDDPRRHDPQRAPLEIWLDAGYADFPSVLGHFARIASAIGSTHEHEAIARIVPVFGSESLRSPDALREAEAAGYAPILSLDHRGGQLIATHDIADALRTPSTWPARVIVMTLDQVGADAGPDLDTFGPIRAQAGQRTLIGAGGIRHRDDLDAAARSGADAWLIASALHDGRLIDTHTTRAR